jgi:hypothetical protein
MQLVIEALVSTATDVSTAGVARIVAVCTSGIFIIMRHGRDVQLPRFTKMDIVLDRELPLFHQPEERLAAPSSQSDLQASGPDAK